MYEGKTGIGKDSQDCWAEPWENRVHRWGEQEEKYDRSGGKDRTTTLAFRLEIVGYVSADFKRTINRYYQAYKSCKVILRQLRSTRDPQD